MIKREFDKLTANQIVAVEKALARCVVKTGPETCVYADGWDDGRVAFEAIPEFKGNAYSAVGRLRIQLGYGKLRAGRKTVDVSDPIEAAYKDLEARVAALERALHA